MPDYYSPLPNALVENILQRKCVLFIGAGISRKCMTKGRRPLPNWYEFLFSFIKWMNRKRKFEAIYYTELKELLSQGKYLIVAEELLSKCNGSDFGEFLRISFDSQRIVPSYLHNLLSIIPFRGIVTTNYDNLIELAYIENRKKIPKIFTNDDVLKGRDPLKEKYFILKMHGDIEDPKSIVLSYRSYQNMMYNSPNFQGLIDRVFKNNTILLIGYGGLDPNIESIIDRVSFMNNQSCFYILSKENTFSNIEKKRFSEDRNLRIIEYVDYFGLHNHVDTFFDDIISKLVQKRAIEDTRPKKLRTRIEVFYDIVDEKDGLFIWEYIFKEGAITLSVEPQNDQYEIFLNSFDKHKDYIDFLIIYIGKSDIKNGAFIKKVDAILKAKKKYQFEIIFAVLNRNKVVMNAKYKAEKKFYLKSDFIDIDLKDMKNYLCDQMP